MTEPQDKWLDLLQQLAEGATVAWDTQDISNDAEQKILQQLQHIEQIQQAFATQQAPKATVQKAAPKALFAWGHLQVMAPLGAGSYGEVFRAHDSVLNREVALKLLKPDQLAAFHSKLFIEEAQRIARVRNRHVLAIHGAGVHDGRVGFWSDLIEGQTLQHQTRVTQQTLLAVAMALADALQAVHEAGLIHGDVKAANVMQDQQGQYVLMDFGAGLEHDTMDSSNHSIGSPMLMAPELFIDQPKSSATDIYALGCLLFKLASDRYPVQGQQVLDIAQAHQDRAYLRLFDWRPDLPRSMRQLLQAMIAPEPQQRPTAATCLSRLEQIRTEPRRRKKKRLVLGIIGSLSLGLLLATGGLLLANQQRQQAEAERQKAQTVNDFLQQMLESASRFGQGREVRVADMLDVAANNKTEQFSDQPHAMLAISEALGRSYQNLQLFDRSLAEYSEQVNWARQLYGDRHPITLEARLLQAKIQIAISQFEPSAQTIDEVIELTTGVNELHNLHQFALIQKADLLDEQGDFEAAENLFKQVMTTQPLAGQSAPNYLFLAMTGLGSVYLATSEYQAAYDVAQQAHELWLADPKQKKTNELVVLNVQGIALMRMGRTEDAERVMRKNLHLAELYYGQNNNGYLRLLINYATVLYDLKQYEQALQYQQQAAALAQQIPGKNHRTEVTIKTNLANTLVTMGDLAAGEQTMREALALATELLGERDLQTLINEYNLAELMNKRRQHQAAYAQSIASLTKAREVLGARHLVTLLMEDNLAVSLSSLGQYQAAAEQHVDLLRRIQDAFGQSSLHVHLVWQHTVDSLLTAGRRDQAVAEQQALLTALINAHGPDHPSVQTAQQRLLELAATKPL